LGGVEKLKQGICVLAKLSGKRKEEMVVVSSFAGAGFFGTTFIASPFYLPIKANCILVYRGYYYHSVNLGTASQI
jgi:hypothetical protein